MKSWRELITETMTENNDSWDNVVHFEIAKRYDWREGEPSLDNKFDDGFGGEEGCKFQLWTDRFVYFPICYDGAEWCGSAYRNPCNVALAHQGGG